MNTFQRWIAETFLGPDAVKAISLKGLSRPVMDQWFTWEGGDGSADFGDNPQGWMNAVRSNVWALNCMKARASVVAQTPMKLYQYSTDGEDKTEVESHPVIDLLETVNPLRDNLSTFRRAIEEQLTIHGTAYVLKVFGSAGKSAELYWLPAHLVEPLPDAQKFIAGYKWLPTGEVYSAERVMRFWYPRPDGSVLALSPTSTALRYINAYNNADVSAESIDKRGGQGGGIVSYDTNMLPVDFARMAEQWDRKRNNPKNAGSDLHMPPGTDYKSGALTAQQMQREERMQRLAKNIMGCYRVPPASAGDYSDASVLANASTQYRALWELFGMDELSFIEETFNNELLWREYPETRNTLYFEHDLSEVTALQEDASQRADRAVILLQGGIASINEAREIVELEPVDDPNADAVSIVTKGATEPQPPPQDQQPPQQQQDMAEPMDQQMPPTKSIMPIVDFVGMTATDLQGRVLGTITKIHRHNADGITATKADPAVVIDGKVYRASQLRVVYDDIGDAPPIMVGDARPAQVTQMEGQSNEMVLRINMPAPVVNVTVPPAETVVNVEATKAEQLPPVVNVTVPTPVVNVTVPSAEPVVNVPAPVVNIEMPKVVQERQTVQRDAKGQISGSTTEVTYG